MRCLCFRGRWHKYANLLCGEIPLWFNISFLGLSEDRNIILLYDDGIFPLLDQLEVNCIWLICVKIIQQWLISLVYFSEMKELMDKPAWTGNSISVSNERVYIKKIKHAPIGRVQAPVALSSSSNVDIIGNSFCLLSSFEIKPLSS